MTTVLITCSGLSRIGRLTTAVAEEVLARRPGRIDWVRARTGPEAIAEAVAGADRVLVLDGCEKGCSSRKAAEAGVEPTIRLISTELGVVKDGPAEIEYAEIEMVVLAVLEIAEAP